MIDLGGRLQAQVCWSWNIRAICTYHVLPWVFCVLLMNNIQNFRKNSSQFLSLWSSNPWYVTRCTGLSYRNRGSNSWKINTQIKRKINGVQISLQAKYFIMGIQLKCEHHIWYCPWGLWTTFPDVTERQKETDLALFPLPECSKVHTGLCSLVFKLSTVIFDDTDSYFSLVFCW